MSSETFGDPETRRRLLEAAWSEIEKRGSALRLSDVAHGAGVSRQAVYLHFGDRAGLLLALVQHMDESLGLAELFAPITEASTGVEALVRAVELHSVYTPKIDSVARVLEAAEPDDEALGAAWRNRMSSRRRAHREIIQRIADDGHLARGWSVDAAADLFYVITMPGPWRELTSQLGWSAGQYAEHITAVLQRSLLASSGEA